MPELPAHLKRHWLLTAYLVVALVGGVLTALGSPLVLLLHRAPGAVPRLTPWIILGLSFVGACNALFAAALLKWRRWGFTGWYACLAVSALFNLWAGPLYYYALASLIPVVILYGLLHIGGDRKAWPRLTGSYRLGSICLSVIVTVAFVGTGSYFWTRTAAEQARKPSLSEAAFDDDREIFMADVFHALQNAGNVTLFEQVRVSCEVTERAADGKVRLGSRAKERRVVVEFLNPTDDETRLKRATAQAGQLSLGEKYAGISIHLRNAVLYREPADPSPLTADCWLDLLTKDGLAEKRRDDLAAYQRAKAALQAFREKLNQQGRISDSEGRITIDAARTEWIADGPKLVLLAEEFHDRLLGSPVCVRVAEDGRLRRVITARKAVITVRNSRACVEMNDVTLRDPRDPERTVGRLEYRLEFELPHK